MRRLVRPRRKLLGEIVRALQKFVIAPATLSWLETTVMEADKTEAGARERALKQLKAEHARLQERIETMYIDRLDGRITAAFFDQKSKVWRDQLKQIEVRMAELATTGLRSSTEAVQTMKSVSEACACHTN